jgi:uncharacterized protein YceK
MAEAMTSVLTHRKPPRPEVYPGVAIDFYWVQRVGGPVWSLVGLIDLPISFLADTLLLPLDLEIQREFDHSDWEAGNRKPG